jgi:dTDP-4-dehydrorhamnose 3,5-epimerase
LIFESTLIPGVNVVTPEFIEDDRGFFARIWCRREFAAHGMIVDMVQASTSHSRQAGTLRGLHFTWSPSVEAKLVRCEHGRIHDVVVDLRPDSPTFAKHFAVVLDDETRSAIYIPPGVAHGFQTLVPNCDVLYMMTDFYRPEFADGVRYNDVAFGIAWPLAVTHIVERDRTYPDFDAAEHRRRFASCC